MLTTLPYATRLAHEDLDHANWPPITAEEIASAAQIVRISHAWVGDERAQWLNQSFCHYTVTAQCFQWAKHLELSSDPLFQQDLWLEVFEGAPEGWFDQWWAWLSAHPSMKVFWALACSPESLCLFHKRLMQECRSRTSVFNVDRFCDHICAIVLPIVQKQMNHHYQAFFEGTINTTYMNMSIVTTDQAIHRSPIFLSLVCKTLNLNYQLNVDRDKMLVVQADAVVQVQRLLLRQHDLWCEHLIRVVEYCSKTREMLSTFDKTQINHYLQKHSPTDCTVEELADSEYALDLLLTYLAHYGLFLEFHEEKVLLYSWLKKTVGSEKFADGALHSENLMQALPTLLLSGGKHFCKYLPTIVTGVMMLGVLIGPDRVVLDRVWSAEIEKKKLEAQTHTLSVRSFVAQHFSQFIVAYAQYMQAHHQPFPEILKVYKNAIFTLGTHHIYHLSALPLYPDTAPPTWEAIAAHTTYPVSWLQRMTRGIPDPIAWAMTILREREKNKYVEILTSRELELALQALDHKLLHHALQLTDQWRSVLRTPIYPLLPLLSLPHFSDEMIDPLWAHLSFLTDYHGTLPLSMVLERVLLEKLGRSKHAREMSWFSKIILEPRPKALGQILSDLSVGSWPRYFFHNEEAWIACAKACTVKQWSECISTLELRDLYSCRENFRSYGTHLFNILLKVLIEEGQSAQRDPGLSEKLSLWPYFHMESIPQSTLYTLFQQHHYELAIKFHEKKCVLPGDKTSEELWHLLVNHGFWKEAKKLSIRSRSPQFLATKFYKSFVFQDVHSVSKYYHLLTPHVAYLLQSVRWGRLLLVKELVGPVFAQTSDLRVYKLCEKMLAKQTYNAYKKLKMTLLMFQAIFSRLPREVQKARALLYLSRALTLNALGLVKEVNRIAAQGHVFDYRPLSCVQKLRSISLPFPVNNVFQDLPCRYPSSITLDFIEYFSDRYCPLQKQKRFQEYFEQARMSWPSSRFFPMVTQGSARSLSHYYHKLLAHNEPLQEQWRMHSSDWLRWSLDTDKPFLVKALLEHQPPEHPSILGIYNRRFKRFFSYKILDWILEASHHYLDIFQDWIEGQSWTIERRKAIFQKAIEDGVDRLAINMAQKTIEETLSPQLPEDWVALIVDRKRPVVSKDAQDLDSLNGLRSQSPMQSLDSMRSDLKYVGKRAVNKGLGYGLTKLWALSASSGDHD